MRYDLSGAAWRKSTYSGGNSQCVEVADGLTGIIPVRDSKAPEGARLVFGTNAWTAFIANLKAAAPPVA